MDDEPSTSGAGAGGGAVSAGTYVSGFEKGVKVAADLGHRIGFLEGYACTRLATLNQDNPEEIRSVALLKKVVALCSELQLRHNEPDLLIRVENLEKLAKQAGIPELGKDSGQSGVGQPGSAKESLSKTLAF